MSQKEREQGRKEKEFLEYVGFDTSYGFWQEDVDRLRKEFPTEYFQQFDHY